MTTPTQIIHDLAGRPGLDDAEERIEQCLVCGREYDLVIPEKKAIPKTDSDRDAFAAPWSKWVCAGCKWCSQGRPPNTLRLWSMLYREDGFTDPPQAFPAYMAEKLPGYVEKGRSLDVAALVPAVEAGQICLTNKADPRPIVRLLGDPPDGPWFCALADSGQIHTVRFARVNYGRRWVVRFERADVASDSDTWLDLVYHVASLKRAEFRTDEILSGEPSVYSLKRAGPAVWREHAAHLTPYFRSELLELVLFCMTREHTDEHYQYACEQTDRRGDVSDPDRGHPDGGARQHSPGGQEQQRSEVLAVDSVEPAGGDRAKQDTGEIPVGAGRGDGQEVRDGVGTQKGRGQLSLFTPVRHQES